MRVALLAWVHIPPPSLYFGISRLFVAISYFVGTFLLPLYIDRKI